MLQTAWRTLSRHAPAAGARARVVEVSALLHRHMRNLSTSTAPTASKLDRALRAPPVASSLASGGDGQLEMSIAHTAARSTAEEKAARDQFTRMLSARLRSKSISVTECAELLREAKTKGVVIGDQSKQLIFTLTEPNVETAPPQGCAYLIAVMDHTLCIDRRFRDIFLRLARRALTAPTLVGLHILAIIRMAFNLAPEDGDLWDAIAKRARESIASFPPEDCLELLQLVLSTGSCPSLQHDLIARVRTHGDLLTADGLSALITTFAASPQEEYVSFFAWASELIIAKYPQMSTASKCTILRALARREIMPAPELLSLLQNDIQSPTSSFSWQDLTSIANSLANLRLQCPALFREMDSRIVAALETQPINARDIANFLLALAHSRVQPSEGLWRYVRLASFECRTNYGTLEVAARMLYAATMLRKYDMAIVGPLYDVVLRRLPTRQPFELDLARLAYVALAARLEVPGEQPHLDSLERALAERRQTVPQGLPTSFSRRINDLVFRAARKHSLGFTYREQLIANLIRVDTLVPSINIVVEAEGPYHFFADTGEHTGTTEFRIRLLGLLGWTVISVPVHHFYGFEERDRPAYIERLLLDAARAQG
eukprot:m.43875 g.43875  ORF g.43875 m.43875 type:complete len:603 (+) comp5799_c0_seq3:48-1856(+)